MDQLHGWLFTYDSINSEWKTTTRENVNELWNNHDSPHVIKSTDITTLITIVINKIGGDIDNVPAFELTLGK